MNHINVTVNVLYLKDYTKLDLSKVNYNKRLKLQLIDVFFIFKYCEIGL